MAKSKIDNLYTEYTQVRYLDINKEQFTYIALLLPSCLLVMSDGLLEKDEWLTLKQLTKILGDEFATEELGTDEKEENLFLIYKAEIRYLLKQPDKWQTKFLGALKEYLVDHPSSREFVKETMELFTSNELSPSDSVKKTNAELLQELGLA